MRANALQKYRQRCRSPLNLSIKRHVPFAPGRGVGNVAFGGRIQPVDATPFHSIWRRWNRMQMEGHARTWVTPKLKAKP